MTRNLKGSLLIASMLVVRGRRSSEACHRRRACQPTHELLSNRGIPTGAPRATTVPRAATSRLTAVTMAAERRLSRLASGYGQPGYGYDFGRPGYNPGGLGGPASGIGVRPGLGAGGFGPGADRPQVLRSPCGGAPAWTYGLTRGGVGGGQLMGAAAGEKIRTATDAAGRHSGGDPAIRSSRSG